MRTILLLMALLALCVLAGCGRYVRGPATTFHKPTLSVDGTNVHVLIPCATLTPFTDYRDFMQRGTISMGDTILLNWKGVAQPEPTNPPDMHILPPAEATLVFDNSAGCQ